MNLYDLLKVEEINVDLNDVLMRNMEYIIEIIFKLTGIRLTPRHFSMWDSPLGEIVGMSNENFLTLAYQTPSTQLAALPHQGAREFLTHFKSTGGAVNIVTATCMTVDQIVMWLEKHSIPFDEIIKTSDKMSAPLLIDDNEQTIKKRVEAGLPTVKFDQPWNVGIECPIQISSWGINV